MSDSYTFDAFGTLLNTDGITDNDYLYSGEQFDAELDNYYLRARYYDQGVGRFTQMDTFQGYEIDPRTLHKYLYTPADPVNFVDPSGNIFLLSQSVANNIRGQLVARSVGGQSVSFFSRSGATNAATNGLPKFLFGSPPKDFGLVGEFGLNNAINAVTAQAGIIFPNKGAFGTAVHLSLEKSIDGYSPFHGVTIDSEVFFLEKDSDGNPVPANKRRQSGSVGIDIIVNYMKKPVIAFDLKTGRGFSNKRVGVLQRRTGLGIVEIKVDFTP